MQIEWKKTENADLSILTIRSVFVLLLAASSQSNGSSGRYVETQQGIACNARWTVRRMSLRAFEQGFSNYTLRLCLLRMHVWARRAGQCFAFFKSTSPATFLGLALTLSSCDQSADIYHRRSSDHSTEFAASVGVNSNGARFEIPRNCLGAPITSKGQDSAGFQIDDDFLLSTILPNFECQKRSNRGEFSDSSATTPVVIFLVESFPGDRPIRTLLNKSFELDALGWPEATPLVPEGADADETFFSGSASMMSDKDRLFIAKKKENSDFTLCNYPQKPRLPRCRTSFVYSTNIIVTLRYSAAYFEHRKNIAETARKMLDGFLVRKEATHARS